MQIEDLGFCKKGEGGKFVADGNLISGVGKLPFNTDGGGLCNNHPTNRGGITKVIEAVRQLRGEAHPKVQVPNCDLAIAHGTGGSLGTRHGAAHADHGKGIGRCPTSKTGPHRRARIPAPAAEPREQAVLGRGRGGQLPDQALHGLRQAALVSAHDLPVLLQRRHRVGGEPGRGRDLHLQRHAPEHAGPLRHRLCDPGRGRRRC